MVNDRIIKKVRRGRKTRRVRGGNNDSMAADLKVAQERVQKLEAQVRELEAKASGHASDMFSVLRELKGLQRDVRENIIGSVVKEMGRINRPIIQALSKFNVNGVPY